MLVQAGLFDRRAAAGRRDAGELRRRHVRRPLNERAAGAGGRLRRQRRRIELIAALFVPAR